MQRGNRRPLSKKNELRLDNRFREMELIYFCLQYPEWKRIIKDFLLKGSTDEFSDPTGNTAVIWASCKEKIDLVERIAKQVGGEELHEFILKGVTEGVSFNNLRSYHNMPCGRNKYFRMYHEFFYILSQEKHTF